MEKIAFYIMAFVAIISAIFMITRKNPVHSVLWMLLAFFSVAGIFIQLNAEFVAAIQIIVYAGAILVLYLFVVMLLNPKTHGVIKIPYTIFISLAVTLVFIIQIFVAISMTNIIGQKGTTTENTIATIGNVKLFGIELFKNYIVAFEIASVMLLIAMIGAIVLARRK